MNSKQRVVFSMNTERDWRLCGRKIRIFSCNLRPKSGIVWQLSNTCVKKMIHYKSNYEFTKKKVRLQRQVPRKLYGWQMRNVMAPLLKWNPNSSKQTRHEKRNCEGCERSFMH